MGLVRGQTKRLDIPGEPGQWVEIKKLSWALLDAARDERSKKAVERAKRWGPEWMQSATNEGSQSEAVKQALADPYNDYDTEYLLKHAVQAWSYEADLPGGVDELDEDTAQWLRREIVDFNTKPRSEAERLDGTSPSTSR